MSATHDNPMASPVRPAVGARKIIDKILAIQCAADETLGLPPSAAATPSSAGTSRSTTAAGVDGGVMVSPGLNAAGGVASSEGSSEAEKLRQGTVVSFEFFPAKVGCCLRVDVCVHVHTCTTANSAAHGCAAVLCDLM